MHLHPAEAQGVVERYRDSLEDARVAGRYKSIEQLHKIAASEDDKSRATAAIYLARREERDTTAQLERELAKLAAMTPDEQKAYAAELGGRIKRA